MPNDKQQLIVNIGESAKKLFNAMVNIATNSGGFSNDSWSYIREIVFGAIWEAIKAALSININSSTIKTDISFARETIKSAKHEINHYYKLFGISTEELGELLQALEDLEQHLAALENHIKLESEPVHESGRKSGHGTPEK